MNPGLKIFLAGTGCLIVWGYVELHSSSNYPPIIEEAKPQTKKSYSSRRKLGPLFPGDDAPNWISVFASKTAAEKFEDCLEVKNTACCNIVATRFSYKADVGTLIEIKKIELLDPFYEILILEGHFTGMRGFINKRYLLDYKE